eukprot:scaffold66947_cov56-Phaeocystis_antarctica.AAC.3
MTYSLTHLLITYCSLTCRRGHGTPPLRNQAAAQDPRLSSGCSRPNWPPPAAAPLRRAAAAPE